MSSKKPSFINGCTFTFEVGPHRIEAWFSGFSGLEMVYVNGNLVSRQRNLSTNSKNTFVIDGEEYSTIFKAASLLKGPFTCTLLKNDVPIKKQKLLFSTPGNPQKSENPQKSFLAGWIVPVSVGGAYGIAVAFELIPETSLLWSWLIVIPIVVIIEFIIELRRGEPIMSIENEELD